MKLKKRIAELEGAELDYAVALALGYGCEIKQVFDSDEYECYAHLPGRQVQRSIFNPSTAWKLGGPLLQEMGISVSNCDASDCYTDYTDGGPWTAFICGSDWRRGKDKPVAKCIGPTPLVAAMRCLAISALGEEIEFDIAA